MGMYISKIDYKNRSKIERIFKKIYSGDDVIVSIDQFHEAGDDYDRAYNVYKILCGGKFYILKRSDNYEVEVYQKLLNNCNFAVPDFYGHITFYNKEWILLDNIDGDDLREFNDIMAKEAASSLSKIANYYWQNDNFDSNKLDERFDRYWKRINKRKLCLSNEPRLELAYEIFLKRQLVSPRTLANGDFLQQNAIFNDNKVIIIDWGFGGIMPYALDVARLTSHGSPNHFPFPYYMDDVLRSLFINEYYKRIENPPEYKQYLYDIRLASLNEYIEFIEENLNNPKLKREPYFDYYYNAAIRIADEIIND